MTEAFSQRTELLIGPEGVATLAGAHVVLAGVGGVGGFAAEALCRAGVGRLTLIDPDTVDPTNANRQIMAMTSTMGKRKAEVMADRMRDIHPEVEVEVITESIRPDRIPEGPPDWSTVSYCVDAIDDVPAKVALLAFCLERSIPVVAAMGAGNSIDHRSFEVADISQTHHCPLAKAVRLGLRKRGYDRGVKVVYKPVAVQCHSKPCGTISTVPAMLGLYLAGEVLHALLHVGDAD